MSGLIDSATMVMRASSVRVDRAAINVANASTPGFKRQLRVAEADAGFGAALRRVRVDQAAGKLIETGRPLDLAIGGPGFFQLRAGDRILYSRQGDFALDPEGKVVTPQGYVLQQADGGDLVLDTQAVTIDPDGTVRDGDRTLGRVALVDCATPDDAVPIDGSLFTIADAAAGPLAGASLRQGAVEASNVSLGDEMTSMMAALRGSETGARLVQVYDDLLGKAIGTFGQVGR